MIQHEWCMCWKFYLKQFEHKFQLYCFTQKAYQSFPIAYKISFRHFKKQICNGFTKRYSMPKCNHESFISVLQTKSFCATQNDFGKHLTNLFHKKTIVSLLSIGLLSFECIVIDNKSIESIGWKFQMISCSRNK